MSEGSHYGVDCRNSGSDRHTIPLYPTGYLKRRVRPSGKSRHIIPINLLCPYCKHVYDYTALDVHPIVTDQDRPLDLPLFVSVKFLCGDGECKSQQTVHVIKKYPNEETSAAIVRLTAAIFHNRCEFGHIPCFDFRNVLDAKVIGGIFVLY
jgi:hypothetical protein